MGSLPCHASRLALVHFVQYTFDFIRFPDDFEPS